MMRRIRCDQKKIQYVNEFRMKRLESRKKIEMLIKRH